MKILFQLNIILQVIWILAIIAAFFAPFYLLYIAFFMGINHMLFSIFLLIGDGKDSKLFGHFIVSSLYLTVFFLVATEYIQIPMFLEGTLTGIVLTFAIPCLLAIHYWYISFNYLNPFKSIEHNVFDL